MKLYTYGSITSGLIICFLSTSCSTRQPAPEPPKTPVKDGVACIGFGPQTPRDIDSRNGENKFTFSTTKRYQDMNLCNIHFHTNA